MAKNTIFLWYDKDAEAAARFYTQTFPDSAMGRIVRAPSDYPSGKKGDVLTVEFTVVRCQNTIGKKGRYLWALHRRSRWDAGRSDLDFRHGGSHHHREQRRAGGA